MRLWASQKTVPKRSLKLGNQNSHDPLFALDLQEILWGFHVVCLNGPSPSRCLILAR